MEAKNKYVNYIAVFIVGFLLGCFILSNINTEEKKVLVEIPEKTGESPEILNPKPLVTVKDHYVYKTDTVVTESQFNKDLADKYVDLEKRYTGIDLEKERLKSYLKSIEIKDYEIPFEDEKIKINNSIKAQGEVLSFKQDYKIKSTVVEAKIPIKKNSFNVYSGVEIGANSQLKDFAVKGNVFLQVPKGNMISVSYDTRQRIWVGYTFKF